MLKMNIWGIYTRDGQYLGQYRAYAPETAFCEYMLLLGMAKVSEQDIEYKHLNDNVAELIYRSTEYFVIPQSGVLNPGTVRFPHA